MGEEDGGDLQHGSMAQGGQVAAVEQQGLAAVGEPHVEGRVAEGAVYQVGMKNRAHSR